MYAHFNGIYAGSTGESTDPINAKYLNKPSLMQWMQCWFEQEIPRFKSLFKYEDNQASLNIISGWLKHLQIDLQLRGVCVSFYFRAFIPHLSPFEKSCLI